LFSSVENILDQATKIFGYETEVFSDYLKDCRPLLWNQLFFTEIG